MSVILNARFFAAARLEYLADADTPIGAAGKTLHESTIRKSAAVSTVKDPEMRIPMGVRCVAWFAVLMFANLPAAAFAQSPCPGIHVKILNIRNSIGAVACALFESPVGFPTELPTGSGSPRKATVFQVGEKILEALSAPICTAGHELGISCSIGISVYPEDGKDFAALMTNADMAMYHAKKEGSSLRLYMPEMRAPALNGPAHP